MRLESKKYLRDSVAQAAHHKWRVDCVLGFNEVQGRVSQWSMDCICLRRVRPRQGLRAGIPFGQEKMDDFDAGRMQPDWRPDGRELLYISSDRRLMAVPVTTAQDILSRCAPSPLRHQRPRADGTPSSRLRRGRRRPARPRQCEPRGRQQAAVDRCPQLGGAEAMTPRPTGDSAADLAAVPRGVSSFRTLQIVHVRRRPRPPACADLCE